MAERRPGPVIPKEAASLRTMTATMAVKNRVKRAVRESRDATQAPSGPSST